MKYLILIFFIFIFYINAYSDVIDQSGTRWPIPDWNKPTLSLEKISSLNCNEFYKFSLKSKKFLTDGLVVIKDGQIQYESYAPHYGPDTPHALWSVSKTITGALLGIAVDEGKVNLDQNLNEFYPRSKADNSYNEIKIKNLFYLDSGLVWNEFYSGDVKKSSVLNMLFGYGHDDMVEFTTSKKVIPQGPGFLFHYSTGTPTITMGVLKNIYSYNDEYDQMPWNKLFNPIGMKHVFFERDHRGVFVGGASAFATPRDMARLGYLYLNDGQWNGNTIVSSDWIKNTLTVSPGYLSDGTIIRDITDDGVYGGSIWLNKSVKKGFGKPYPTLPGNMFLAMGQFGQYIIVLPDQKMVIARTGHDNDDDSSIDKFVSLAISCFDDPHYPRGKIIPAPAYSKDTLSTTLETLKSAIKSNMIQRVVAKSVCSCHFISG